MTSSEDGMNVTKRIIYQAYCTWLLTPRYCTPSYHHCMQQIPHLKKYIEVRYHLSPAICTQTLSKFQQVYLLRVHVVTLLSETFGVQYTYSNTKHNPTTHCTLLRRVPYVVLHNIRQRRIPWFQVFDQGFTSRVFTDVHGWFRRRASLWGFNKLFLRQKTETHITDKKCVIK